MSTKRDAEQGAGVESGLSSKEKIGRNQGQPGNGKMDNYRPRQPSSAAQRGHKIK